MPIKASQMATNTIETTIDYEGDTVKVVFYPNKVTNKAIAQLDGDIAGFDATLAELIKEWDVLEDDGSMFALNPESLATLSFPFRVKVARGIMEAIRPNSQTA